MSCQNLTCANENFQRRKILWQMYYLLEEMENQAPQPSNAFPFSFLEMGIAKVLQSFEQGAAWLTDRALESNWMKKRQRKYS